jgi:hypothetical protein
MKIEIDIPTTLNEVKLGSYQKFINIEEPTEIEIIQHLLGVEKQTVLNIKASSVDLLSNSLTELFKEEHTFADRFKLNGVTYGFIPKLDDITYGENKDLTTYLNWDDMHKAMAVMYRPIKQSLNGKYIIEDYKGSGKYSEIMLEAPLGVVFGAMVFFWRLTNELLKAIPNYLETEAKKEQMQGAISAENGEAIQKSIHLLRETLGDLQKLQGLDYMSV